MQNRVLIAIISIWIFTGTSVATSSDFLLATARLGDRFFIDNVLNEIFGPSIAQITQENVLAKSQIFQGPCSIYGTPFTPHPVMKKNFCYEGLIDSKLELIGKNSTLRNAMMIKVCDLIVKKDQAINFALNKAGLGLKAESPIDREKLNAVYQLFYPLKAIPETAAVPLLKIAALNTDGMSKWKGIFHVFCLSPMWQTP